VFTVGASGVSHLPQKDNWDYATVEPVFCVLKTELKGYLDENLVPDQAAVDDEFGMRMCCLEVVCFL